MKLYGGIDLHSNNSVIALLDEEDRAVYRRRLGNDLGMILNELAPHQASIEGLVHSSQLKKSIDLSSSLTEVQEDD